MSPGLDWIGWIGYLQTGPFLDHLAVIKPIENPWYLWFARYPSLKHTNFLEIKIRYSFSSFTSI